MRKVVPIDITRFIQRNEPCRRVHILKHFIKEIDKGGRIDTSSESTIDKYLGLLKASGKIKQSKSTDLYTVPQSKKPQDQNTPKSGIKQEDKSEKTQEKSTITDFATTTREDAIIAESMRDTIFLLDSAMYLLDTIHVDSMYVNSLHIEEMKNDCRIFKAAIEKILNDRFTHLLEPSVNNKYQKLVETAWKQYSEKHKHNSTMVFNNISDFRNIFSDVILQIRQGCEDNCKKFAQHETNPKDAQHETNPKDAQHETNPKDAQHETNPKDAQHETDPKDAQHETYPKDAVYASCKLISVSLNEICRNDYDLVVDLHKYDEKIGCFAIDISELKMLVPYDITRVYCNGKECIFDINSEKKSVAPSYSDHTLLFYPDGIISDDSVHTISIMMQCVEFSFVINGKQEDYPTFLDHIKNDVIIQIDSVYVPDKSDTIMLTSNMEGQIKEKIESCMGKEFDCSYCEDLHPCHRWLGDPYIDGTPDGNDKKYSMKIKCWNNNNYISLHKILKRITEKG